MFFRSFFIFLVIAVVAAVWVFSSPIYKHFVIEFATITAVIVVARHLVRG